MELGVSKRAACERFGTPRIASSVRRSFAVTVPERLPMPDSRLAQPGEQVPDPAVHRGGEVGVEALQDLLGDLLQGLVCFFE